MLDSGKNENPKLIILLLWENRNIELLNIFLLTHNLTHLNMSWPTLKKILNLIFLILSFFFKKHQTTHNCLCVMCIQLIYPQNINSIIANIYRPDRKSFFPVTQKKCCVASLKKSSILYFVPDCCKIFFI